MTNSVEHPICISDIDVIKFPKLKLKKLGWKVKVEVCGYTWRFVPQN